jgi:ABC-type antimicrobial peptide transport system ATPase subunit
LGNNKFSTIDSSLSSLNFHDLELSFINNLKFLNVSKKNFQKIIDNKKARWRYDNKYIKYISWYKYQANSLVTYNNSQNFEDEVLKYIKNSSPLKTQQIIVPHEEIKRLMKLFDDTNNLYFKNPDIIVLEKNSLIKKYSNINLNEYCLLKTPQYLYIYVNLEKTNCDHV